VSRLGPGYVPLEREQTCYADSRSDRRIWKREVDVTAQVVLLTIGAAGGLAVLGWWLVRFVSGRRYRKMVNDRLEALELGVRIRNACSEGG
jgi:hypothetical protein